MQQHAPCLHKTSLLCVLHLILYCHKFILVICKVMQDNQDSVESDYCSVEISVPAKYCAAFFHLLFFFSFRMAYYHTAYYNIWLLSTCLYIVSHKQTWFVGSDSTDYFSFIDITLFFMFKFSLKEGASLWLILFYLALVVVKISNNLRFTT